MGMRVAVLISGQPRFNNDFNMLLSNLKNYDRLDFFFYLWNSDASESHWIPPTWPKDYNEIRSRILKNLSLKCNIADLKILPQIDYQVTREYNLTPWSNPVNIWYNFYGTKQVNLLREEYEKENGNYDLVIKSRPDVGLASSIDCASIKKFLDSNPTTVIMPNDRRFGMAGRAVNDLLGIGLGSTMSVYCGAVDYLDQYNDQGAPYHGESLLAWHLTANKILSPNTNFNCTFREDWYKYNKVNFGNWL
jgi:hypothetical protein